MDRLQIKREKLGEEGKQVKGCGAPTNKKLFSFEQQERKKFLNGW